MIQRIRLLTVGVFISPIILPFMKSDTDYNFRKKVLKLKELESNLNDVTVD